MLDPMRRRDGESETDYQRFCLYRDLGPGRSLQEAAKRTGLCLSRLKQLSSQHSWSRRAALWDILSRHRRRERALCDSRTGREALLKEAADLQGWARTEVARWLQRDSHGEIKLVRALSPGEALRLWQVGAEAEQRLVGYGSRRAGSSEGEGHSVVEQAAIVKPFLEEALGQLQEWGAGESYRDKLDLAVLLWLRSVLVAAGPSPRRTDEAGP